MSEQLRLVTVAFNKPRLIAEQIRLIAKNLQDDHLHIILDNSTEQAAINGIRRVCTESGTAWFHTGLEKGEHHLALNMAWAKIMRDAEAPYVGFLDHDVFPLEPCTLVDKIAKSGFYGIGQRHSPTDRLYLWPGFCFFSREWLAGRDLNFDGIRGAEKADDGDTGSANWPLFEHVDWEAMFKPHFGYGQIRRPDDHGLQSFGYERFDESWLHFTNGSGWKDVPAFEDRERLLYDLIADK